MKSMTRPERIKKIEDLVKDIRVAMLVTMNEEGHARSRPMWTQEAPFDGTLWFLTSRGCRKVQEIEGNPRVNIGYASPSSESYVSVSGRAEVLNDRARIKEFWSPMLKAWFDGPEDPEIRVLRVDVEDAEYWDTPGGKVGSLISLAKRVLSGDNDSIDDDDVTGTVEF